MEPIADPRVLLAAARCTGAVAADLAASEVVAAAAVNAASAGRAVVDVHLFGAGQRGAAEPGIALGWSAQATPTPEDDLSYPVRRWSGVPRLAWACCLGLAWPDRTTDPYPGESFDRADVVDLARDFGAQASWVKAAVDHDLRLAGLVVPHRGGLRLGPAAAVIPAAHVEALRRLHDRLPRRVAQERQ
jgi:hypothetical protein